MTTETYKSSEDKIIFSKIELFLFYILFALAIFYVYIQPENGLLFFSFLLAWAWFSKKDYFWLAFFFLILQVPSYFFMYTPTSHLPLIQPFHGISLTPLDLFTILMLIKVIFYRKRMTLKLKTPFTFLGFYFIFSFLIGGIFYSSSFDTIAGFIRPVLYLSWIIFFPALIENKENIFKFLRLLFPIVFFIIFTQLYYLAQDIQFINLFDPYAQIEIIKNTLTGELRPVMEGVNLVFLCYIGALFLIQHKKGISKGGYIYLVLAVSFLSIFISASRIWFGIFLFIGVLVYFRKIGNLPKILISTLSISIIASVLIKFGIISASYLRYSAWARVSQIFDFVSGKALQIDTFTSRLIELKPILKIIGNNLFFGYGFSDVSFEYYTNNWGFFNTILMFGVIGFSLFIFLIFSYIKMMSSTLTKLSRENPFRESLKVLLISFWGMLIGYFLTWDFFSLFYPDKVVFIVIFFAISEIFITHCLESDGGCIVD